MPISVGQRTGTQSTPAQHLENEESNREGLCLNLERLQGGGGVSAGPEGRGKERGLAEGEGRMNGNV